jgi:hypothetical protein
VRHYHQQAENCRAMRDPLRAAPREPPARAATLPFLRAGTILSAVGLDFAPPLSTASGSADTSGTVMPILWSSSQDGVLPNMDLVRSAYRCLLCAPSRRQNSLGFHCTTLRENCTPSTGDWARWRSGSVDLAALCGGVSQLQAPRLFSAPARSLCCPWAQNAAVMVDPAATMRPFWPSPSMP